MADPDEDAAARRIMTAIGAKSRLPIGAIDGGDVGVLLAGPVGALFLAVGLGVESLALPLVLAGLGTTGAVVLVAPAHRSAASWLEAVARYAWRPRRLFAVQPPSRSESTDSTGVEVDQNQARAYDPTTNDGGLGNMGPFSRSDTAEALTDIERILPGDGVVERSDGALVGFLEVEPDNMDFAMSEDWATVQRTAASFANTDLDAPLILHATTEAFPTDALTESIADRLADGAVATETFERLLEEYRTDRVEAMRARGTQQLRFYVGVAVDPVDVHTGPSADRTPAERLAEVPLLGALVLPFVTRRGAGGETSTDRQAAAVDEHLETVRRQLVQDLHGWSARRCSTADLVGLQAAFWNGSTSDVASLDAGTGVESGPGPGSGSGATSTPTAPGGGVTSPDGGQAGVTTDATAEDTQSEASGGSGKDTSEGPGSAAEESDAGGDGEGGPSRRERVRRAVAPDVAAWDTRSGDLDGEWTRTLFVAEYPDYPSDGFLSALFTLSDVRFDLTVRLHPRNDERARAELERVADDLQVDADLATTTRQSYLERRAAEARATYGAVEDGQRVFDLATYVTVRADTKAALEEAVRTVTTVLRDDPAHLTPMTAICRQRAAMRAAAPLGRDTLDRSSIALGGAVGATLASLHSPTIREPEGVEVGVHKDTGSPMVVDPFGREDGYATFTVGDTGSGKSFAAKQQFVRALAQDEDRIGIILEPLNDWVGVAEALDATRITVGGRAGLNPLEIRPTPDRVQRRLAEDASPFNEKLDDAISFLVNFFASRGVPLEDRRSTLELGLREAYRRQGITADIATHDRESPTIRDMLDVFEEMAAEPADFVVRSETEADRLAEDAAWLLAQLRPFEEGGRYEHLGRASDVDVRGADLVYLDLAQQEGSVDSSTALTMQLLISLVYERAKTTDAEVVLVIDEARYIMQDTANLTFLETVFRHHRHHSLSIRLVTQTVDEFFEHPESEAILDQCAVKQFHRLDGMDARWAEEFGLNHAQMRYVQEALPGSETRGYAEALIGLDGEWRGIEVQALDYEQSVID